MIELYLPEGEYYFEIANRLFPIKEGYLRTQHFDNGAILWDWMVHIEARPKARFPENTKSRILYEDESSFIMTLVEHVWQDDNKFLIRLMPYDESQDKRST